MSPLKSFIAVLIAGLALEAGAAAQSAVAPSIKVDAQSAAHANLLKARAAAAPFAFQEEVVAPSSEPVLTNVGVYSTITFEGHVLSAAGEGDQGATKGLPIKILYAPSEADDPAYRAAIGLAAAAQVDYFDTRVATPSVATLLQYDAVYTWVNFAYQNSVGFGDNLASYNDNGGNVVLGTFCTFTTGNSLNGMIMTPAYCPVDSPMGTNHFSPANYIGDGTTCIYNGVNLLNCQFRDFLVIQGTGVKDGTYSDNEICHAFRSAAPAGAGTVAYSNGSGAIQLAPTLGPWATAVANCATCVPNPNAWTDQGSALAGVSGDPLLEASGSLIPTTRQFLTLSNAAPSAASYILASGSSSPTPFKGGTLLPGPTLVNVLVMTSPAGGWQINYRAPAAASGTEAWIQVAIVDAAAVQGVALSNAVMGIVP